MPNVTFSQQQLSPPPRFQEEPGVYYFVQQVKIRSDHWHRDDVHPRKRKGHVWRQIWLARTADFGIFSQATVFSQNTETAYKSGFTEKLFGPNWGGRSEAGCITHFKLWWSPSTSQQCEQPAVLLDLNQQRDSEVNFSFSPLSAFINTLILLTVCVNCPDPNLTKHHLMLDLKGEQEVTSCVCKESHDQTWASLTSKCKWSPY